MIHVILAISVIALDLLYTSNAMAGNVQCKEKEVFVNLAVIFGNGMKNTPESARNATRTLKPHVISKLGVEEDAVLFYTAINIDDVAEQYLKVVKQRLKASTTEFVKMINGIIPFPDSYSEVMDGFISDAYVRELNDHNLQEHLIMYKNLLDLGRKIVVVAHSQGNLYANAAYDSLFSVPNAPYKENKNAFRIVSVGTPANRIAGNQAEECGSSGCYTTFVNDCIMNKVNFVLPDTLDPYLEVSSRDVPDDTCYHGFVGAYLKLESSRNIILDQINWQYFYLDDIERKVLDGPITATLSWEGNADLDLHVYERDYRSHVYSMYPTGSVGILDIYDDDAEGMEHYYAECKNIKEGLYEFAVGYYEGDGPVTVDLTLQSGTSTQSFTERVEIVQGKSSYTDPTPIVWLEVIDYGNGTFGLYLTKEEPEVYD